MKIRTTHAAATATTAQLDLFDTPTCRTVFVPDDVPDPHGKLVGYDIYFMLLPPRDRALIVEALAMELRSRHGLKPSVMPCNRLHHTLRLVHNCGIVLTDDDQAIIDTAMHTAGRIAWHQLSVQMDRAVGGTAGHLVLRCTANSEQQISAFGRLLGKQLRQHSIATDAVAPHMTMLYGADRALPEQAIEPISWTATRFALVASHHGLGHHQVLGEWPLMAPH